MAENTADFRLARVREWGIHRVYGYPGDGISAIFRAFNGADSDSARIVELASPPPARVAAGG